nr:LysM peptidoglycan-binding domain-containing protein [Paenibacillus pinistramenti]
MLKYSTYKSIYSPQTSLASSTGSVIISDKKSFSRLPRKSHVRMLLVIAVLVLSFTGFITAFASSSTPAKDPAYETIVVMSGDTLWNIALTHKPDGMDTRKYVHKLIVLNHLSDSGIAAGDVLNLPNIN